MSLKITDSCINCGVCELACPNQAISEGEIIYEIDPSRCTECIGHFNEPQCQELCPIELCITADLEQKETHDELFAKYHRLTQAAHKTNNTQT